jgi:hypothetical protein
MFEVFGSLIGVSKAQDHFTSWVEEKFICFAIITKVFGGTIGTTLLTVDAVWLFSGHFVT